MGLVGSIHPPSTSTALKTDESDVPARELGVPTALISHRCAQGKAAGGFGFTPHSPTQGGHSSTARTTDRCGCGNLAVAGAVSFSSWRARSAISGRAGKRDEANLPCDASTTNTLYLLVVALEAGSCLPSLVSP